MRPHPSTPALSSLAFGLLLMLAATGLAHPCVRWLESVELIDRGRP